MLEEKIILEMSIRVTFGRLSTEEHATMVEGILDDLPEEATSSVVVSRNPSANMTITVANYGERYTGNKALQFLANYVQIAKLRRRGEAYATRVPTPKEEGGMRDRLNKTIHPPTTEVDTFGRSEDETYLASSERQYLTSTEDATAGEGTMVEEAREAARPVSQPLRSTGYLNPKTRYGGTGR